MFRSISVITKLRLAILTVAISGMVVDFFIHQSFHASHLMVLGLGILLAEFLNREIKITIRKARQVLTSSLGVKTGQSLRSDEITTLGKTLSEAMTDYSPQKKVEKILKKNRDIAEAMEQEIVLRGKVCSGKSVIGTIWNKSEDILLESPASQIELGYRDKLRLWKRCVETAESELEGLEKNLLERSEKALAGIIRFQILMLTDRSLQYRIKRRLAANNSMVYIVKKCFNELSKSLTNPNPKLDRSADIEDLEYRLLKIITREEDATVTDHIDLNNKVVLSRTLLPSQLLQFHRQGACGFITLHGQETSHVHILQTSMNIPSVSSLNVEDIDLPDGTPVIIDGDRGTVIVRPTESDLEVYQNAMRDDTQSPEATEAKPHFIGEERVWIHANLNVLSELDKISKIGADGIGLFRSEMQFLIEPVLPSLEKQREMYAKIANSFPEGRVTLRLIDSGGDKVGKFQDDIEEENPSMGYRSIRFLLKERNILLTQMQAMIEGLQHTGGNILVPMISTMEEVFEVRKIYDDLIAQKEDPELRNKVKLQMMVETPAMVTLFDRAVDYFDGFSIGSNDLIQYSLAADRNNSSVAEIYNRISPAILRMIKTTVDISRENNKPISICGELAHDERLLPIFIGMGLRSFSVNYQYIAPLSDKLKELELSSCEELARFALNTNCEEDILKLLENDPITVAG